MADFETLLRKYMSHVAECEGVYFLPDTYDGFTAEECAELKRISEQATEEWRVESGT